jgi:hypothetical protein
MTFRQWLKKQVYRDDPVSDLAIDFLSDKRAKGLRSVESIRTHILTMTADDLVLEALDQAIREYKRETKA